MDGKTEDLPAGGSSSDVVVRKSISSMSDAEQDRFWKALRRTMIATDGPGSSEFFRIASYHGEPGPFHCAHVRETFPGWHRIYLVEMEHALQAADRQNGNDGKIFLPYWDWANNFAGGLPDGVRKQFSWPDDLFPVNMQNISNISNGIIRVDDKKIADGIRANNNRIPRQATDCLRAVQHWRHASMRYPTKIPSLEMPHNLMHVVIGGRSGQMASPAYAAYDFVFWLHHCNVDRIYERYLKIEPDSQAEFQSWNRNLYNAPLKPFRTPNGNMYYPRDTFSTINLGYVYDDLPPVPPETHLRVPPTHVIFDNVKLAEFEGKCYQIHVYVVAKDTEDEFKEPQTNTDVDYEHPNYAGFQAIFNRGTEECASCAKTPPIDILLDISQTIMGLGISRYNAKAKVYLFETSGDTDVLQKVEDNEVLPNPRIIGPLFEDMNTSLNMESRENQSKDEVMGLQRYLVKFGYLAGGQESVNGDYDKATMQAVKDFQIAVGQQDSNGVADAQTKLNIVQHKRCQNVDPFAENDVRDEVVSNIDFNKTELAYFVKVSPGYLVREEVLDCFVTAFQSWADVCALSFNRAESEEQADIVLSWSTGNEKNDIFRFDGPGGVLGIGGNGFVQFDIGERWTTGLNDDEKEVSDLGNPETWHRGQPKISLYYTAVHEIGHALGLDHSQRPNDVMSPWYDPTLVNLTQNDIQRIQEIRGVNHDND